MSAPRAVVEALPGEWVRVRVDGQEYVLAAACPHRKGRLVHGYVNVRKLQITCPLHGSTFDLITGCPVAGPGTDPLPVRRAAAYYPGTADQDTTQRRDSGSES